MYLKYCLQLSDSLNTATCVVEKKAKQHDPCNLKTNHKLSSQHSTILHGYFLQFLHPPCPLQPHPTSAIPIQSFIDAFLLTMDPKNENIQKAQITYATGSKTKISLPLVQQQGSLGPGVRGKGEELTNELIKTKNYSHPSFFMAYHVCCTTKININGNRHTSKLREPIELPINFMLNCNI